MTFYSLDKWCGYYFLRNTCSYSWGKWCWDILSGETFRFAAGGCVGNFATLWCLEKDTTKNMSTARNWWIFCCPKTKMVICWGEQWPRGRTGKSHESWSEVARALLTRTKGSWSLDTYSKAITSWHVIYLWDTHHIIIDIIPWLPPKTFEAVKHAACPACPAVSSSSFNQSWRETWCRFARYWSWGHWAMASMEIFIIRSCGKKIRYTAKWTNSFPKKKGN